MRHLALSTLLLAAACGDNLEPQSVEETPSSEHPDGGTDAPPSEPRALVIDELITTMFCDGPQVELEIAVWYADAYRVEGPANYACKFTFDNSVVVEPASCGGRFPLAEGGPRDIEIEVTDLDTGAVAVEGRTMYVYPGLEIDLQASAPACGLEVSYVATQNVAAFRRVDISPAANVVGDSFRIDAEGTFTVTQPGTYTVELEVEDETSGPICVDRVTREVTVTACPDDHEHEPGCGHM